MNTQISRIRPVIIILTFALIAGCGGQQHRTKSSVVDYLYPDKSEVNIKPSVPVLNIPARVGIAFVPDQATRSTGVNLWGGANQGGTLTEAKKTELLEIVADHFKKHEFVSDIEVIPSAYLTEAGSFSNLDQIKTMYGIDVIALVSYDQVQFTDENWLSLSYWTIVGAYVVSGEKNDTSTMIDTVVYDIKSRKMLFRAPGTSNIKGSATPVNLSEQLRTDSIEGYEQATADMIKNLDIQLTKFKDEIKTKPEEVKVIYKKGYSGGGATGLFELAIMLLIIGFRITGFRIKRS